MKYCCRVVELVRRIAVHECELNRLTQLTQEAFWVFDSWCLLNKMDGIFKDSWTKLLIATNQRSAYDEVEKIFRKVTQADINRDEFKKALEGICESIEKHIKEKRVEISEEKKMLHKLYNEFAESTGDLKFIFKDPHIRELIMEQLLKF